MTDEADFAVHAGNTGNTAKDADDAPDLDAIVQVAVRLSGSARDVQLVRQVLLSLSHPGRRLVLSLPELATDGQVHAHGTITLIPDPQIE